MCAIAVAICLSAGGARPAAQNPAPQGNLDFWERWYEDQLDYEEAMAAWRAFILQLHLMLIRNLVPTWTPGSTPPPTEPPKPPEPPANPDVVEIHGDSGSQAPQPVEVIPLSGDGSDPVDEVMEPVSGYTPVAFRRPSPVVAAPFVVFTADRDGLIEMRVIGPSALRPETARLLRRGEMALMPVAADVRRRIESFVASVATRGSGVHVTRMRLRAYCVESAKPAAAAGTMFIPADRAAAAQFSAASRVRSAAEYAASHGLLTPQGDYAEYGRFVTQYAIWTRLEHWDQARFTREFLGRSRPAAGAAHGSWTGETEQTLRALAPARWRDIEMVLRAAAEAETRVRRRGRHD
jgi:hypothetical protein